MLVDFRSTARTRLSSVPRAPFRPGRYTRVSVEHDLADVQFHLQRRIRVNRQPDRRVRLPAAGGPAGKLRRAAAALPPAPTPTPTPSACPGAPPVSSWVCVNGGWLPPDHPLAAVGAAPAPPPAPAAGAGAHRGARRGARLELGLREWWLVAAGPSAGRWPPPPPPPPAAARATGACTHRVPWRRARVELGLRERWLVAAGSSAGRRLAPAPAPPAPAPSSCTTPQPGANWYCVNGGWVPPNSPMAPGGACVGAAPAAGLGLHRDRWLGAPESPARGRRRRRLIAWVGPDQRWSGPNLFRPSPPWRGATVGNIPDI